jgi:hypothetical protein
MRKCMQHVPFHYPGEIGQMTNDSSNFALAARIDGYSGLPSPYNQKRDGPGDGQEGATCTASSFFTALLRASEATLQAEMTALHASRCVPPP